MGGKRWTAEEELRAKQLLLSGRAVLEIAIILGKTGNSIFKKIVENGRYL